MIDQLAIEWRNSRNQGEEMKKKKLSGDLGIDDQSVSKYY
jgi:hypothetical protein